MMINKSSAVGASSALKKTNKALSKILNRLSTAKKINKASDDASGLAISEQLGTQVRGFQVAERNVSDAMSALRIADGTSQEVSGMLQRQRELALRAQNDTLTNEQRSILDKEYQNLSSEIDRIADGTQFNTQDVANGTGLASGNAAIQAGANAGDQVTLPSIDMTTSGLAIAGTSVADSASASVALTAIDTALDKLNGNRSTIGAMSNRFESTQNNLIVAEVNTTAAQSVIADQDMAKGLAELTKNKLLNEMGVKAFSQFNKISSNHIISLLQ